jgi:hypothetical protein
MLPFCRSCDTTIVGSILITIKSDNFHDVFYSKTSKLSTIAASLLSMLVAKYL